jgi:uncharacterized membrane protein YozB (DUF420 family)
MTTTDLPALNATLNGLSTVLLAAGFLFIRRKQVSHHKLCMLVALGISALFLISYVIYHALHGSTKFIDPGPLRWVYYTILLTHVVLAAAILPMVLITIHRALRGRYDAHRRIARWTWPLWMYVSVTGVLVYLMLYKWFPGSGT